MNEIEQRLQELEQLGLSRRLRLISGPQGPTVLLDGRPVLLLCSNNYLGLADHPRVREAAADAAMRWGVGAGASRLVSGTMTIHRRLEERLADFKGSEACLLFGSGYLANIGVIGALAGRGDVVFSDELNHASIIDGCRLSRAEVVVYRHRDVEHLDWSLRKHARKDSSARRLVVTDAVFSMDGDVAPLQAIAELAHAYGARVLVDEAHATGNLGPGGRGAVAEAGLEDEIDVIVGTLGKALGSYGAYVCASAEIVSYLVNTARSLIFSTAPSPPAIAGALAALELLRERPHRVQRLRSNARALRRALASEGFPVADTEMHIVPLIVGDEHAAMRMCQDAIAHGAFAQAIRSPTVAIGGSRLRLTAMASHTASELELAATVFGDAARALGLEPASFPPALDERAEPAWQLDEPEEPGRHEWVAARELDHAELTLAGGTAVTAASFDFEPAAPFDFEREHAGADALADGGPRAGSAARAPFDLERDADMASVDASALPATQPFDVERELADARDARAA